MSEIEHAPSNDPSPSQPTPVQPPIIWGYTRHPEDGYHGRCVSRADALAEGARELDLKPGDRIWLCQGRDPEPKLEGAWVAEQLAESVEECLPEQWADWPDLSPEQEEELGRVLTAAAQAFLERHGLKPEWYEVITEESCTVPAPEVAS
jgi:hypothetical protein